MTDARFLVFGLQVTVFGGFLFLGDHYSLTPSLGYWLMILGVVISIVGPVLQAWQADVQRQSR